MGLKIINPIYDVIMSKMPFGSDKNSRIFEKKDTIESQELLNILNKEKQTPVAPVVYNTPEPSSEAEIEEEQLSDY